VIGVSASDAARSMIVRMQAALREGAVAEDVLMQVTFAPFRTLDIALSEELCGCSKCVRYVAVFALGCSTRIQGACLNKDANWGCATQTAVAARSLPPAVVWVKALRQQPRFVLQRLAISSR
jgi:hypothetical protein